MGSKNNNSRIEPIVMPALLKIRTTIDFDGFFMMQNYYSKVFTANDFENILTTKKPHKKLCGFK